jgi:hypothetical protein
VSGGPSLGSGGPSGAQEQATPTLLLLVEGDDVLIATCDLQLGHKVSARAIPAGDRIRRCGVPIGSATVDIEPGAWVHTHNLASDYLVTFAHRGGER